MKRSFIHDLHSSFTIWFDHTLLQKGEAFTNVSGSLYKMADPNISGFNIWGSPYKQWVYDSSVSGVNIPSGISSNAGVINRSGNSNILDFERGRFLTTGSLSSVSCSYSVKDFNIYTTNKSDQELVFENRYLVNPSSPQVATGVREDKLIAPCIFIKIKKFSNKEFSYGGNDMTTVNLRAVIISDDEYKLNSVGNIFVDKKHTNFLLLDSTPINRYGDIKNGYYNYNSTVISQQSSDKIAHIEEAVFTKLAQSAVSEKQPDMYIGFLDFNVDISRWPRG